MSTTDEFLMRTGAKSASFLTIGAKVSGVIVREPELRQQTDFEDRSVLKTWEDGSPMMQIVVILATSERDPDDDEDNGERGLYLKGNMLKAVQKAVKEADAKGLRVGGKLVVQFSSEGVQPKKGLAKPKLYVAKYEAPDPMAAVAASEAAAEPAPAAVAEESGADLKF